MVASLVAIVELSALLGLEETCEAGVQALAAAAGLPPLSPPAPAPYGTAEETTWVQASVDVNKWDIYYAKCATPTFKDAY